MSNNVVNSMGCSDPFKEEISQLRALLAEGGLDGNLLEGRYLNQLKRVRQLTVQLETEKTNSRQLAAQLVALEAKQKQGTGSKGGEALKGRVRQPGSGTTGDENEEQQNTSATLRERLERAYTQLNETKLQLEEQKKETQRMRKVLQHEIGGMPQELEALLKNMAEGGGGWRGRAQQIVVLKSKVKELERALATRATSVHSDGGGDTISTNGGAIKRVGGASVVTDTTTAVTSRNRDMDDVARERVVELQNRRLLQQRELQEALDRRTAELEAQKRRVEAAQARYVNLEADNHTLREYLQTVIEKTENDNALIDAYREELADLQQALRTARVKLREWEEWESGESKRGDKKTRQSEEKHNGVSHHVSVDVLNTETAVALAGADAAIEINSLKMQNEELRLQLARIEAAGNHEQSNGGSDVVNKGNHAHSVSHKSDGVNDDTALLVHWLRSVAPSLETTGGGNCAWQTQIAEVLRQAQSAVSYLQQQRDEDGVRLSRCYETIQRLQKEQKKQHVKKEKGEGGSSDGNNNKEESKALVNVILQENHALKRRVRMLQELMEKERVAYESLHLLSTTSQPNGGAPAIRTTGNFSAGEKDEKNGDSTAVSAAEYHKLQCNYEELRCAFNSLQKELFRRRDD